MGNKQPQQNEEIIDIRQKTKFIRPEIIELQILVKKKGRITKEYQLLNPAIGKGSSSEIRKGINKKTGIMRAIKIVSKNLGDKENDRVLTELKALEKLDHPNIIKINEYYQDDRFHYMVTEYYPGGELFHKIEQLRCFSEEITAKLMYQLLCAVNYCHNNHIVHRDIRPENILFDRITEDGQMILIDFGSCSETNQKMTSNLNHAYYTAPEIYTKKYNKEVDIWSCGIIMYILLCGYLFFFNIIYTKSYPPFRGKSDQKIKQNVLKGIIEFDDPDWQKTSIESKELIKKLLTPQPERRITAQQALLDPWFSKFYIQNVNESQLKRVINNIVTFNAQSKLQEGCLQLIVLFLASREELSELRSVFLYIDQKHDGYIDQEEIHQIFLKIMDPESAQEQAEKACLIPLSFTSFITRSIDRQALLTKNRIETAFKLIDRNSSGGIALEELKEAFKIDNDYYKDPWKEVMLEVDQNRDQQLSLLEFKEMILGFIQK